MSSWDRSLALGHDAIDRQHAALLQRVDDLLAAMGEGRPDAEVLVLFDFLEEYTWHHLALEERIMRESRYPRLGEQLALHDAFRHKLDELSARAERELTPRLAEDVRRDVRDWLVDHMGEADRKLGAWLADWRPPRLSAQGRPGPGELLAQIEAASHAHTHWKTRLREAVEGGRLDLPLAQLADDQACAFGLWVHALALPAGQEHRAARDEVVALHTAFHKAAGRVGVLVEAGRRDEALQSLSASGELGRASRALLRRLETWEG
jgi:hemerythrin